MSARPAVQLTCAMLSVASSVSLVNTIIAVWESPAIALVGGTPWTASVAGLPVIDIASGQVVVEPLQLAAVNLNQLALLFMNTAWVTPSGPLVPPPMLLTVMFDDGCVPMIGMVPNAMSVTEITPVEPVPDNP